MKVNIYIARLIKSLLVIVVLLVFTQGILVFANITFTSDKARRALVEQIKTVTQRETYIEGQVQVTVSLLPEVIVERIHIKNVDGFSDEDFIFITKARVQISLMPLLTGNLVLDEIEADDAQVSLILNKEGKHNWTFDHFIYPEESVSKNNLKAREKHNQRERFSFGVLRLTDINIIFTDESDSRVIKHHFSSLLVDIEDKTRPEAAITGSLQEYPYHFSFESDSLNDLASGQLWSLRGTGTIADRKAEIEANILLDKEDIEGSLNLNINDINLGLLLEHSGIVSSQDAASRALNVHAEFKGDDLADALRRTELEIHLLSGYLKWHAILKNEIRTLTFNKIALYASWDKPVKLHLDGKLFDETVKLDFTTNHLHELVDGTDKLDVDVAAHVAGSDVSFNGNLDLPINRKKYRLAISFKGKDLEKLNRILNSELPPFNNYSLTGNVSSSERGYIVRLDDATIGDTHFKATVVIDTSSFKPFWSINLSSK
ncbi:MAG: AsmA family protein, partial [Gammaproteobacteria bacterium]